MSVTVPSATPISDSYSPVTGAGANLIPLFGPWLTLHLAWYLDGIAAMFEQVFDLVAQTGEDDGATATIGTTDQHGNPVASGYSPPFGALFDPNRCPAQYLPWLGQWVGVQVPTGSDPTTARSLVLEEAGFKRGGTAAIVAAAKRFLTGTQSVIVIERTSPVGPDPYWLIVIVRPEEVTSTANLIAAINAAKPGGIVWQLTQTDGFTWASAIHTWAADTFSWATSATSQP